MSGIYGGQSNIFSLGLLTPTIGPDADSQHVLPDVAADTIALVAATQTLTNKTLTSPKITALGVGDIVIGGAANAVSSLADEATGKVLVSGGVGAPPAWSANPQVSTLGIGGAASAPLQVNTSTAYRNLTTSAVIAAATPGLCWDGSANGGAWLGMVSNVLSLYVHNGTGNFVAGDLALEIDTSGNWLNKKGYLEMIEMAAPANAAANKGRIFMEDNGAGKTRLMVIFASGAAQQIAIEP